MAPWTTSWTRPDTDQVYSISLARPANMDEATLEACYSLIETTSRDDYAGSALKWRPDHKREEMRSPDLRYIVVRGPGGTDGTDDTNEGADVCAFTSLMPTYEEGHPVVYCYEIHLAPTLQGSRLGRVLLGFQSVVAHNLGPPVSKVMLTCFLSNARALRFYERQGFVTDATAPTTRRLRGGKTFVPDYTILSKAVVR